MLLLGAFLLGTLAGILFASRRIKDRCKRCGRVASGTRMGDALIHYFICDECAHEIIETAGIRTDWTWTAQ